MSIEENLRLASEYVKASNEQDWDRFAAFFADEKVGSDYRAFEINQWIPAFPDSICEITSMTAQDDRVVIEGIVHMTHAGELTFWVNDAVPATNKKVEFHLCTSQKWENGKIAAFRTYLNPVAILSQLGVPADNIDWPVLS